MDTSGLTHRQTRHNDLPENLNFDIDRHIFRKPPKEKPNEFLIIPEAEKIEWEVEVHEDYNTKGDLGLILQFSGIEFPKDSLFEKSRANYGENSSVFYSRIGYKKGLAFLVLTTCGDIFESQVVAKRINVKPFFREEIFLPQLTVTHDPTSMTVRERNNLIVVGYNRL